MSKEQTAKPLSDERKAKRAYIAAMWRKLNKYGPDVELVASDKEWKLFERLLDTKYEPTQ